MTRFSRETLQRIQRASELITQSQRVVVLTGAGISTPSGIPDFRSPGTGLWTRFVPMEVASLSAFRYDPEQFYKWFHPLAIHIISAKPNPAHVALAKMQASGRISTIITQNIDGLHTRSGVKDVIEVHGTLNTLTCTECFRQVSSARIIQAYIDHCAIPHCQECGGILKPDVILYEEQLPVKAWSQAEAASKGCDLMLIVGTSLEVMPSARLPILALEHEAKVVVINNAATYIDVRAEVVIHANVADIIPRICTLVLPPN
ncbi:MAG: SIR2 family NAD-dependent protein deacylase [Acidobacteriaceae bacterium]